MRYFTGPTFNAAPAFISVTSLPIDFLLSLSILINSSNWRWPPTLARLKVADSHGPSSPTQTMEASASQPSNMGLCCCILLAEAPAMMQRP